MSEQVFNLPSMTQPNEARGRSFFDGAGLVIRESLHIRNGVGLEFISIDYGEVPSIVLGSPAKLEGPAWIPGPVEGSAVLLPSESDRSPLFAQAFGIDLPVESFGASIVVSIDVIGASEATTDDVRLVTCGYADTQDNPPGANQFISLYPQFDGMISASVAVLLGKQQANSGPLNYPNTITFTATTSQGTIGAYLLDSNQALAIGRGKIRVSIPGQFVEPGQLGGLTLFTDYGATVSIEDIFGATVDGPSSVTLVEP